MTVSKYLKVLLIAANMEVAFLIFSHRWFSNVSSESIMTPISLLKFHPEKCKHMKISKSKNEETNTYKLLGQDIETVTQERFNSVWWIIYIYYKENRA
jgi:hypothetical protein